MIKSLKANFAVNHNSSHNIRMEIVTLSQRPELEESLIKMIETSFGYTSKNSFRNDFNPLIAHNHKNLFMIVENDQVLSHVGMLRKKFKILNYHPVALLGGIATHPDHRSKGYSKTLIEFILKNFSEEFSLFFLWSNLVDYYAKFNFHLAGGFIHAKSNEDGQYKYKKTKLKDLSNQQLEQIITLYNDSCFKHFAQPVRSTQDWKNIVNTKSIDLFLSEDDSTIKSYYLQNKGQDLQGVVFEVAWANDVDKIDVYHSIKNAQIWLPESEKVYFESFQLSYLGMLRISNPALFNLFLADWSQGKINYKDNGEVEFEGKSHKLAEDEILNFIFGPNPVEEFQNIGKPLFISGADSI